MYLGIPKEDTSRAVKIDFALARQLLKKPDWQSRQTAARWLGHMKSREATDLLVTLVQHDPYPVVQYTAAVAIVIQGTEYSMQQANHLQERFEGRLKIEIEEAIKRWEKER